MIILPEDTRIADKKSLVLQSDSGPRIKDCANTKHHCQSLNRDAGSPDVLVIVLFIEKGTDSVRDRKRSSEHLL